MVRIYFQLKFSDETERERRIGFVTLNWVKIKISKPWAFEDVVVAVSVVRYRFYWLDISNILGKSKWIKCDLPWTTIEWNILPLIHSFFASEKSDNRLGWTEFRPTFSSSVNQFNYLKNLQSSPTSIWMVLSKRKSSVQTLFELIVFPHFCSRKFKWKLVLVCEIDFEYAGFPFEFSVS